MSSQLQKADVPHAVIDTDELDHVYPAPVDQAKLSERNLAALSEAFREYGVRRFIVVGVYMHLDDELASVRRATQADRIHLIELEASDSTLTERIARREIGSEFEAQLARTLSQSRRLANERPEGVIRIKTDGTSITATASQIVELTGWAS